MEEYLALKNKTPPPLPPKDEVSSTVGGITTVPSAKELSKQNKQYGFPLVGTNK